MRIANFWFLFIMQQHTWGVVGNVILILLEIYCCLQQWKNFANSPKIDKVIAIVRAAPFLTNGVFYLYCIIVCSLYILFCSSVRMSHWNKRLLTYLLTCTDVAQRRLTKLCTTFGRLLRWYTIYTFSGALAPNGILPCAVFTLRPSLAFSYIGSVTARYSSSGCQPNFAA